jgi:hypothetical protein
MNDEGLADARAASPFRLPRLHPGIGFGLCAAGRTCLLLLLQRRAEAKTPYGRDHLLDGDLSGVESHDRLLRLEAYVCPVHALQPFQGLLDRDWSGPSRHSINGEDDGRGRSHPDIHGDQ